MSPHRASGVLKREEPFTKPNLRHAGGFVRQRGTLTRKQPPAKRKVHMIRKPEPSKAVQILRNAFAEAGATLGQAKAYDILAALEGYRNWAHAKPHLLTGTAPVAPPDHVDREAIASWPTAVIWEQGDDDGESETFHILDATLDTVLADKFGRLAAGVEPMAWPDEVKLCDESRRASMVLEEVHAVIPRIDRYGIPTYASEREVGQWATEDMGWRYLGTAEHPLVRVFCANSGDDGGAWFAQVRLSPELYSRLTAAR